MSKKFFKTVIVAVLLALVLSLNTIPLISPLVVMSEGCPSTASTCP